MAETTAKRILKVLWVFVKETEKLFTDELKMKVLVEPVTYINIESTVACAHCTRPTNERKSKVREREGE